MTRHEALDSANKALREMLGLTDVSDNMLLFFREKLKDKTYTTKKQLETLIFQVCYENNLLRLVADTNTIIKYFQPTWIPCLTDLQQHLILTKFKQLVEAHAILFPQRTLVNIPTIVVLIAKDLNLPHDEFRIIKVESRLKSTVEHYETCKAFINKTCKSKL